MGTGEVSTPTKPSKPMETREDSTPAKSPKQNEPQATPSQPDWSTYMQVYYGAGATPPFFTSNVASSPIPHPYFWRPQNHFMQPFGTPLRQPALYHHEGLYAHPNVFTGSTLKIPETEGKVPNGKDLDLMKKCKGSSKNMGGGRSGGSEKAASGSGYDGASQSAESGSEGSSDASDDNANQEYSPTKKRSFDQIVAEGANTQNNGTVQYRRANHRVVAPGESVESIPASSLNKGTCLNASPAGLIPMEDECELKRERRKQSNRESARRSRLRKQQDSEKLQTEVKTISDEISMLKDKITRISEECMKLKSENDSIMEELIQTHGPDAISTLATNNPDQALESVNGESISRKQETPSKNNSSPEQNRDSLNANQQLEDNS